MILVASFFQDTVYICRPNDVQHREYNKAIIVHLIFFFKIARKLLINSLITIAVIMTSTL